MAGNPNVQIPKAKDPNRGGRGAGIASSLVARIGAGLMTIAGVDPGNDFFGPGQPIEPVAPPDAAGRAFDFPVNVNVQWQPKTEASDQGTSFDQLRGLADSLDILRAVIETRKDQMAKLNWTVKPILDPIDQLEQMEELADVAPPQAATDDTTKVAVGAPATKPMPAPPLGSGPANMPTFPLAPKAKPKTKKLYTSKQIADCRKAYELLKRPDGVRQFKHWLRPILEDLFVLDAPAIYVRRSVGKVPLAFEVVDGATIKRLIDEQGRTPASPSPAYQQILKGLAATNLTADDLIYFPRNQRSWKLYGYSHVEQIVMTINTALRRQLHVMEFYTEGSLPDSIASVPDNWSADNVEDFQKWWDSELSNNTATRRRVRFIPNGITFEQFKEQILTDKYDEWVAKIVCYVFGVSSQPFSSQVNRATAQTMKDSSQEEGLEPLKMWVKDLMDDIIRRSGVEGVEFCWEEEGTVNPLEQAQIDQIMVNTGIMEVNEVRDERGMPPLAEPQIPTPLPGQTVDPLTGAVVPSPAAGATPPTLGSPPGAATKPQPAAGASTKKMMLHKGHRSGGSSDPVYNEAATKRIRVLFSKFLRSQINRAASHVTKMSKSAAEDRIMAILESYGFKDIDVLKGKLEDILADIAAKYGDQALRDVLDGRDSGVTNEMMTLANDKAIAWAEKRSAELVTQIEESTREFIRKDVVNALENGYSTEQLTEDLIDNYAFSDARAEMIARTELAEAMIEGNLIGWRESGVVEQKEWNVGDGCCEECEVYDGQAVDLDDDFPEGDPPLHPNCRCDLSPIVAPTEGGDQ